MRSRSHRQCGDPCNGDPRDFEHVIGRHPQKRQSNEGVHVMERHSPHAYEQEEEGNPDYGRAQRAAPYSGKVQKSHYQESGDDQKAQNKALLDHASIVVPTARKSFVAGKNRQQGLQVELLVKGEQAKENGYAKPYAGVARHIALSGTQSGRACDQVGGDCQPTKECRIADPWRPTFNHLYPFCRRSRSKAAVSQARGCVFERHSLHERPSDNSLPKAALHRLSPSIALPPFLTGRPRLSIVRNHHDP